MKRLRDLLPSDWLAGMGPETLAKEIRGVTADSRQVSPGMIFVATRGETQDGHRFIPQAHQAGAALIVGEDPAPHGIPYLKVDDGRRALARIAAAFFGNPSHQMLMVGVTGTSGKTTTSYLVESILEAAGHKVGLIGTVVFRYPGKILDSTHTTPGASELQELLAEMRDAGCTAVVMEVSSHALKQHRVGEIAFDAMIFTNLTPEHLDYHPDMEDYFGAKALLFTEFADVAARSGKKPVASIGVDGDWGKKLIARIENQKPKRIEKVVDFSAEGSATFSAKNLRMDLDGIHGTVAGIEIDSELTARFNIANILGAAAAAQALRIDSAVISRGIRELKSVPGRLEAVPNDRGVHVFVDYAHKPDALEKVLRTLRDVKASHRLITVFGCGGDRDRTKRPVMGRLAAELSDFSIVTSDNPRTENPQSIIDEILAGMRGHENFSVELDRKMAIENAIRSAKKGDVVLIAGKGHEDYQIIGKTKVHFDDREIAREVLKKK